MSHNALLLTLVESFCFFFFMQGVEVEPEVDFDLLADKTAGYSGDDITGVCRDAAMNGMRRKIMGKTPEQIRYMHHSQ